MIGWGVFAAHRMRAVYAPLSNTRAHWYNVFGQIHELLGYIGQWHSLAQENEDLRHQVNLQLSILASDEALKRENASLHAALNLSAKLNRDIIPAGIFSISSDPSGSWALINRGTTDGVANQAVVLSSDGILIGQVSQTFAHSARVILLTDPGFKVTARVQGGQTSGVLQGDLNNGMQFNLVVQTDSITEGDTIVSSGDDMVPAGILIGTVENVASDNTNLFKKIRVKPSINLMQGDVVVIKP